MVATEVLISRAEYEARTAAGERLEFRAEAPLPVDVARAERTHDHLQREDAKQH